MAATNFDSPVICVKIVALVFGVIVLGLGLFAHFNSTWTKTVSVPGIVKPGGKNSKVYKVCDLKDQLPEEFASRNCPTIAYEFLYVSMIIICFIFGVLGIGAGFFVDLRKSPIKYVDVGYHVVAGLLLTASSGLYILSAIQIDSLVFGSEGQPEELPESINFRKWEKIGASLLTFMWALFHGIIAELIVRC